MTTSIIAGFSLLCLSLTGAASACRRILCMQIDGLIPLMSATVHPNAALHSFNTCRSFSSCSWSSRAEMITGSVLSGPRNAYFRVSGSCFNIREGGSSTEGLARGCSAEIGRVTITSALSKPSCSCTWLSTSCMNSTHSSLSVFSDGSSWFRSSGLSMISCMHCSITSILLHPYIS